MDPLSLFFLGVIAVASVLQGVFLIALVREGRRTARRLDLLAERLSRELAPSLEELSRALRNVAEVSERTVTQARRVDALVGDAVAAAEGIMRLVEAVLPMGGRLATFAFLGRLLRKGIRIYRRIRGR